MIGYHVAGLVTAMMDVRDLAKEEPEDHDCHSYQWSAWRDQMDRAEEHVRGCRHDLDRAVEELERSIEERCRRNG